MIASAYLPRQDIPEIDKTLDWFKKHADFAEAAYLARASIREKINSAYKSYNGETDSESIRYLVSTYGQKNRNKYVAYRLSKSKMDIIVGEFLKMNLNSTIKTINSEAVTEKTQKWEFMLGASYSKNELNKLKEVGVDIMEGAEVPNPEELSAFKKMNFKSKEESIMQILLNSFIQEDNIMDKFAKHTQDCTITSRHWGRLEISEVSKEMTYRDYNPECAIVEEFERDPYYERSSYMGSLTQVPIHEILTKYELTKEERDKLDIVRQNPGHYIGAAYRNRYSYDDGGQICADVLHFEWKGVRPKYFKKSPKTKSQLFMDDSSETITMTLSPNQVREHEQNLKNGKESEGEITIQWEPDLYECLRIGFDIMPAKYQRRKPFQMRDEDTGKILGFSYFGGVFNKVEGVTVSLKEICQNFDDAFDTIMYQILREVNKAKGKVIMYDRAYLPKGQTVKNVLYQALNDSFIDYNSAASGNMSGKDIASGSVIREIDLGVSNSINVLLQLKNEIIGMMDMITGIHGAREGKIAASASVTNSQQSDEASRTITEPMFYHLTKSFEKIMLGILETGKLVWSLYQPNKARMILGDEKFSFMKMTSNIAYCSYMLQLVNPRWEAMVKKRIQNYAELAFNAKETTLGDMLDFEMQETLADARATLKNSWERIQKIQSDQAKANSESAAALKEKELQTKIQIANADREDRQEAALNEIDRKGQWDLKINSQKDKNKMILDEAKTDFESQEQ